MEMFEYIAVLTSIIIGLDMAQLLLGLTRLIQHPEQAKPYWVHLCWVFYMFVFAVFWWWWEFKLGAIEVWTFGVYLFVIFYAFLVFLLCSLLFPTNFPVTMASRATSTQSVPGSSAFFVCPRS